MNTDEYIIEKYFGKKLTESRMQRYGTTFKTKNKLYFYDSGTGKVVECTEKEYALLSYLTDSSKPKIEWSWEKEDLETNVRELAKECREYHLLDMPQYTHFVGNNLENLISNKNEQVSQVILELTQQCNLRCKYCIFNEYNNMFRDFELKHMKWETAKAAIDFAFEHSTGELYVTFYGGEPLLNYKVLKQSIEYAKSLGEKKSRKVVFNFTTNMTLITEEMAEYFASVETLNIMGSLDGPKDIHDLYRRSIDNQGSFDKTIRGLKYLIDAFGDTSKIRISINGVLTPPYTRKKFNIIKEFFKNLEWLPKGLQVRLDYVDWETLRDQDVIIDERWNDKDDTEKLDSNNPLTDWCTQNMCSGSIEDEQYEFNIQKMSLVNIHKRYIGNEPIPILKRNGCCMPGSRRLYITVDGNFQVCERVGDTPSIGNINGGIDYQNIEKYYIKEYEQESIKKCNECWACHLCTVCYVGCFSKTGIDCRKKDFTCMAQRLAIKNTLKAYFEIVENKPELLECLDKMELA